MLKSINTNLLSPIIFISLLAACGNKNTVVSDSGPLLTFEDTNRLCSEYEIELLRKAGENDFTTVRQYLDEDGDPNLNCVCNTTTLNNGRVFKALPVHLSQRILISLASDDGVYPIDSASFDFILYYLTFNLSEEIKSDYLTSFLGSNNSQGQTITKILIDKGAKFQHSMSCIYEDINDYRELGQLGYNFNVPDSEKNGKTILMELAECPCDKVHNPAIFDTIDPNDEYTISLNDFRGYNSATEIIEIMNVIIQFGARTDVEDYDGNKAIDLVVNPEIRAFLKSKEK